MAVRWLTSILVIFTIGITIQAHAQSFEGCEEELESAIAPSNYCVKGESICSIEAEGTFSCTVNVPGIAAQQSAVCTDYFAVAEYNGTTTVLQFCIDWVVVNSSSNSNLQPSNSQNSPQCPAHSTINMDTSALDETVDLVGVPFSLTYASDRFRSGFSYSTKTIGAGGWIPSNLEHYDTANQILYTGDGGLRPVTAQATSTGGYYVASSNASEVYYFDSNGNHLYTKDALTGVTKFTFSYDSVGRLSAIADQFNNQTTFQYSTSAAGSAPGGIVIMTAPFGQKTILVMDSNGMLASVTSPGGATNAMTYDSNGNLLSFQKPMGQASQVTYDSNGNVLKDQGAGGDFLSLLRTFDATTGLQTVTATTAMGRQTIFATTASSTGSTHGVTPPYGGSTNSGDNNQGPDQFTSSIGVSDNSILTADPRFGWMAPYTSLQTNSIANSNIDAVTATNISATLANPSDPLSVESLTTTTTLQNDPTRTFTSAYTAANEILVNTSPVGRVMTSSLTPADEVASVQVGNLTPANLAYDSHGRLTQVSMGARKMNLAYNSSGNVQATSDFLGHVTSFSYDPDGHVIRETRPDGSYISFTYDKNGNMTSITPPSHPAHNFAYNLFDLIGSYLPPSLGGINVTTNYQYNLDKQLTEIDLPTGQVVDFNYGSTTGLLNSITTPTGSYNVTYDPNSNLVSQITSPDNEALNYQYLGNILSAISSSGPTAGNLNLSYNADGTVASMTPTDSTGAGTVEAITYDKDGLVTGVGDLSMTLNQNGEVSGTTLGQTTESLSYNSFGETTSDQFAFTSPHGNHRQHGLFSEQFTRDNLGRIVAVDQGRDGHDQFDHDNGWNDHDRDDHGFGDRTQYIYDNLGRLTKVLKNNFVGSAYKYDENGNRIEKIENGRVIHATYDNQDRLLTYGNTQYQYDNNGTPAEKTVNLDDHPHWQSFFGRGLASFGDNDNDRDDHHERKLVTKYKFDVFGNLQSVTLPDGRVISYIVDGQNRRVGKFVNGKLVRGFIYQSQTQIAAELDGSGHIVKQFIYGTKSNVPDYMIMNGREYRIISSQVGTPLYIVDSATGRIVERETMDEFGYDARTNWRSILPFGFAGGIYDRDTGLVRFGARDYDPETGRWVSKDPDRFGGGDTNLFSYVSQDPLNAMDPSGLYGTNSCSYYTQKCQSTGGVYYCTVAPIFCKLFPTPPNPSPGNPNAYEGFNRCMRQCLQDCDQRGTPSSSAPSGESCGTSSSSSTTGGGGVACHLSCANVCGIKGQNPVFK